MTTSPNTGKFFNHMNFEIPMRQVWIPNAPSIKLKPGEIIEGPVEYLSSYSFLKPVPFPFHQVESMTQETPGNFKDSGPQLDKILPDQPKVSEQPSEPIQITTKESVIQVIDDYSTLELPFDPKKVNWVSLSIESLLDAALKLGIDLGPFESLSSKDKKWELVRAVKKATGLI